MLCVMMVQSMKTQEKTTRSSSTAALASLYDAWYGRIYAYCVHRLFCRTAAEDVTSQVFLSVAEQFDAFEGSSEHEFSGWVYAIAVNQCNSYIRKNLRRRKIFEKFQQERHRQSETDEASAPPVADWPAVYAAIARLKEIEQTIITLRFFENLSYSQIATIINKRENSVRVILHRGLKKLRQSLSAADGGFADMRDSL